MALLTNRSLSPGLFKGSTTTLDGIGLRPMPAERPKTLRKLKSVYDASPTEPQPASNLSSNGQSDRNLNGVEEEVRRRSNTTSSTHSGDKSLSILSPFDEQVILDFLLVIYVLEVQNVSKMTINMCMHNL